MGFARFARDCLRVRRASLASLALNLSFFGLDGMRRVLPVLLALGLGACAASSGVPATSFSDPRVGAAYLPLSTSGFLGARRGAAVVIAKNVAVTNAHNANLLDPKVVIGTSKNYDLLFFHTDSAALPPSFAQPRIGEAVLAYGEGKGGELRVAHGTVTALDAPVEPVCPSCDPQTAFTFSGDAGEGFSGGPVVDAGDGHVIGIVFGYTDGKTRTIYAYSTHRVSTELQGVEKGLPVDLD